MGRAGGTTFKGTEPMPESLPWFSLENHRRQNLKYWLMLAAKLHDMLQDSSRLDLEVWRNSSVRETLVENESVVQTLIARIRPHHGHVSEVRRNGDPCMCK